MQTPLHVLPLGASCICCPRQPGCLKPSHHLTVVLCREAAGVQSTERGPSAVTKHHMQLQMHSLVWDALLGALIGASLALLHLWWRGPNHAATQQLWSAYS